MDDDITKKVQNRYAELPADVKKAVESADLNTRVQTIGVKNHLHLDQMGVLQDETLLVMLGFESPDNFVNALTKALNISPDQAAAVSTDINNEIFAPIRESLKKFSAPVSAPAPTPSQTPATIPTPVVVKPAPVSTTPTTTPATPIPKAQVPLAPHPHDLMLVEKTVTTPPAAPEKPTNYKTDPYRELPQ